MPEDRVKLIHDIEESLRLQDYAGSPAIAGVELVDLRRFHDAAGSMTELARLSGEELASMPGFRPAQINYSTLEPGAIKGLHLHRRQTDVWFVPPHDRVLLVLVDAREGSETAGTRMRLTLGDGTSRLVRVPPGVAHGCRNIGRRTATVIYFADLQFSPEPATCDEGRLAWDHFGAELWDIPRD